jgi:desampylase
MNAHAHWQTLTIEPAALVRLSQLAVAGYPLETCGLLLAADLQPTRITQVHPLRNVAPDPRTHFAFDPLEYLQVERAADEGALRAVGVWHTHPDGRAQPSEEDRQHAWPGWCYLILAVDAIAVREIRAWRLCGAQFLEEALQP